MQMISLLLAACAISWVHYAWLDSSNTEIVCMILVLTALLSPLVQGFAPGATGFVISFLTAGLVALSAGRNNA